MNRTSPAPLLLLLASVACTPDKSDDLADTSTDTTDASDTDDTDDTATSDTGEDPFDFPPVLCDEMTCGQGLLCVKQGLNCDYGQDPPMFYRLPSTCAEVPSECIDAVESEISDCLEPLLCDAPGWDAQYAEYSEGTLQCPNIAADCY